MSAVIVPYVPRSYDDGRPRLMVECLECGIEWGWTLETSKQAEYLPTMAADHNAQHHLKGRTLDIATCTDRQYWNLTGMCGGCISEECHPGIGCTNGPDYCRYCKCRGGDLTPPAPKQVAEPDPNQMELEL